MTTSPPASVGSAPDASTTSDVIVLLVNPAAGGGRAARKAAAVHKALSTIAHVERMDSRAAGDERRIARLAAQRGVRVLAVVGGDGSISQAARGLLDENSAVPLAIFGAGTGNDFAKTLRIPVRNIAAMAALVAAERTQMIDVGFVDDVPFVNAAGFGFDVHVLEQMRARPVYTGTAAYVLTALRALSGYRAIRVRRAPSRSAAAHLLLVFANGQHFGGAFHIAPNASLNSGALDMIAIGDVGVWRRLQLFAHAIRGTHLRAPEIDCERHDLFDLTFDAPPRFDADGELHQAENARVIVSVRSRGLCVVSGA